MTVLVTGGAGYIGSHTVLALSDRGERVVVLDNLSTGIRALVGAGAAFVEGDAGDGALVARLIGEHGIDSVIHFAGSIVVPDSVARPLEYYANNTVASRALIEACVQGGVKHFVFSSTAVVYGKPDSGRLREDGLLDPISPYGRSKLMTEWILQDTSRAYPEFRHIVLRYFNVAGADAQLRTGQSSPKATHLIKRACQVALGQIPHLDILGTDFPTPDGTGVRDYIHVSDLADIHLRMLDELRRGAAPDCFNCGYGTGFSVRDVVRTVEQVIGRELPVREGPARPGDPASLIADPTKLNAKIQWQPKYRELATIIASALEWEKLLARSGRNWGR